MRRWALLVAFATALAACTGSAPPPGSAGDEPPGSVAPVPASPESESPAPEGPGSAAATARRLCGVPEPDLEGGSDVPAEGPTPPVIEDVMEEVEQLRGFDYAHPVVAQPVGQQEIADDLVAYADIAYPQEQYGRRSLAWDTIGVIPDGTSLRAEYENYGSSQVIGYYDTLSGELKFIGSQSPTPLERITLAHELTHAIDDQRFGLERLDVLSSECRDEESAAAIALVEGNATFFMLRWAQTFLTPEEQVRVGIEAAQQDASTDGIPPFIVRLQGWSYDEGLKFVGALESRGGLDAVDGAFEQPPVSTEQIIHPERYPNDAPTPIDVEDLSAALGEGWDDLDVMTIGEAWLALALGLRLDPSVAAEATAGWDGGVYRAWSDGEEVALVLSTAWDSVPDAEEFASAMQDWIDAGDDPGRVLEPDGARVTVVFSSDDGTLDRLEAEVA
ncbi:MAG TPA: hypothetical protein VJ913_03460 [Actinomycetota bacterium]|nr:hypothetical protein [Actinomycetota bacterium]